MNAKLTDEHRARVAVVYVRQSTMTQVHEHAESRRRQYALADKAHTLGFARVETIDEDQGRSGSGAVERSGFEKLAGMICRGIVGAVFCLEASRLARNGREWHQLLEVCALCATLVIDSDDVYDPQRSSDRLMLGLKGTMAEFELSTLRARAIAARDSKAQRGELRRLLPAGYCWSNAGKIEIDADERVSDAVRMVFRMFRKEGSARQAALELSAQQIELPVRYTGTGDTRITWQPARYGTIVGFLRNPIYAGAYVFGRKQTETRLVDGRVRKTGGHLKPREQWKVVIRDAHEGYLSWSDFEENQRMLRENAHNQKHVASKPGRGGGALLSGLLRCGRCGRMLRVAYDIGSSGAHRYYCLGAETHDAPRTCVRASGIRVDRAVCMTLLDALAPLAIDAAIAAAERVAQGHSEVRTAIERQLEEARYEAQLAERRHAAVDPDKRLVARELETRWEKALEHVRQIEARVASLDATRASQQTIHRDVLLALASDLRSVWNADTTDPAERQRLARTVIVEVVVNRDDASQEQIIVVHWKGGQHTEIRIPRSRHHGFVAPSHANAVEVIRSLGGAHTDREIAATLNRMRIEHEGHRSWTAVRVAQMRARLGIGSYQPDAMHDATVSLDEAARRLSVDRKTVRQLIREKVLPASQAMPLAPWRIPTIALETEAVQIGRRRAIERRLPNRDETRDKHTLKLPGV